MAPVKRFSPHQLVSPQAIARMAGYLDKLDDPRAATELRRRSLREAAKRARLAPTREDHWMNRQGDRLRQAIDRKIKFTLALLKLYNLAQEDRPNQRKKRRKTKRAALKIRKMVPHLR